MGRPASHGVPRAPCYSGTPLNGDLIVSHTGLSPSVVQLSRSFRYDRFCNPSRRPQPRDESRFGLFPLSLAATDGIDVSFFSSRYLDVSVPWVRLKPPMNSEVSYLHLITGNPKPHRLYLRGLVSDISVRTPKPLIIKTQGLGVPAIEGGFPHSEIRGSKLLRSSPRLIAA